MASIDTNLKAILESAILLLLSLIPLRVPLFRLAFLTKLEYLAFLQLLYMPIPVSFKDLQSGRRYRRLLIDNHYPSASHR